MYVFEQIDIHLFGSTPRASDLRIVFSFVMNLGFVIAMNILAKYKSYPEAIIMGVILAYFSSHNVFHNLGLIKPFKVINEKL
jgi:hypothetical protein